MTPRNAGHGDAGTARSAGDEATPPETPATADEALTRAREHGRAALAEALRALRCLLDALSLATGRDLHGDSRRGLGRVRRLLEAAAETLERGEGGGDLRLLDAVAEALDAEIARWEERGREDAEARAVLRAFLGLREILWELGVRPGGARPGSRGRAAEGARGGRRRGDAPGDRPSRVERVPVEG